MLTVSTLAFFFFVLLSAGDLHTGRWQRDLCTAAEKSKCANTSLWKDSGGRKSHALEMFLKLCTSSGKAWTFGFSHNCCSCLLAPAALKYFPYTPFGTEKNNLSKLISTNFYEISGHSVGTKSFALNCVIIGCLISTLQANCGFAVWGLKYRLEF